MNAFRRAASVGCALLILGCSSTSDGILEPPGDEPGLSFAVTDASILQAVPVRVDFGVGGTIGVVRLSVLRGLVQSGVFEVDVTVTDLASGDVTHRVENLSDTELFGGQQSQAIVGVDWGSTVPITNGADLSVCAFVTQHLGSGDRVISETACATITPT